MFTRSQGVRLGCYCVLAWLSGGILSALELRLTPSPASTVTVGEPITLTIDGGGDAATTWYQFTISPPGAGPSVIRDFTRGVSTLDYTPMRDGAFLVRVTALDTISGEMAEAQTIFDATSRVASDGAAVVTPTRHPLIFLYSAPPCSELAVTAHFTRADGSEPWHFTAPVLCDRRASANFWIAGLEPGAKYLVHHQVWTWTGQIAAQGPELVFTAGTPSGSFRDDTVAQALPDYSATDQRILLESQMSGAGGSQGAAIARRIETGSVVWYYDPSLNGRLRTVLRPLPGGDFFVVPYFEPLIPAALREIDIAGSLVRETNVEATSIRLQMIGRPPIIAFHHDALRLANGRILALAQSQRTIPGDPPRTVLGDVIILLDSNFDILWVWDSFEKLDVNRRALLEETAGPAGSGPVVEDWTHGNAIQRLSDGNLLFSIRHQDWVVKIDFQDGLGSGKVIWRFGKDGDFTTHSTDPWPWFSHQHDAHFDGTHLMLYDNGNVRYEMNGESGNSRGQVWVLDETAMTADLVVNVDLGGFSAALGSAQALSDGHFHFLSGYLTLNGGLASQSVEVDPDTGGLLYINQNAGLTYRSFRLADLYHTER